jgi:hypothetical protein
MVGMLCIVEFCGKITRGINVCVTTASIRNVSDQVGVSCNRPTLTRSGSSSISYSESRCIPISHSLTNMESRPTRWTNDENPLAIHDGRYRLQVGVYIAQGHFRCCAYPPFCMAAQLIPRRCSGRLLSKNRV